MLVGQDDGRWPDVLPWRHASWRLGVKIECPWDDQNTKETWNHRFWSFMSTLITSASSLELDRRKKQTRNEINHNRICHHVTKMAWKYSKCELKSRAVWFFLSLSGFHNQDATMVRSIWRFFSFVRNKKHKSTMSSGTKGYFGGWYGPTELSSTNKTRRQDTTTIKQDHRRHNWLLIDIDQFLFDKKELAQKP